ncbi:MarR family winged helix-turn-helix transcriptional regulator [Candidatus Formimonas warabiya]|uniref:HTH marR-type domain-containing protein n=1 Tax=Formimonas warabiya TaxID=1761012 RepID=A0A3G1KWK9_FORW1|nr:MarR family transcriptional regulator [Candidatus Formimonas warabiya]ATW26800.1 hypothetical protein DCMF_20325 [Candidatus Formimonas warabiya]
MDTLNPDLDKSKKILELFRSARKNFRELFIKSNQQHQLTESKLLLISELRDTPFITLQELSKRLFLAKGTVSSIVTQLEEQGIVIREIPKDNRRIVKLSLAPGYAEMINNNLEYFENLVNNTDPEDVDRILEGLQKLCELLEKRESRGLDRPL